MAAFTQLISGKFRIYHAGSGVDFPNSWPANVDTAPSGFTAIGNQLISTDGITLGRSYTTNMEHVLAYAEPVSESLESVVHTISFDCLDMSSAFFALVTGNTAASGKLALAQAPGALPIIAVAIIGPGPKADKLCAWHFAHASVKIDGDTVLRGGNIARTPVMLTPLVGPSGKFGSYIVQS